MTQQRKEPEKRRPGRPKGSGPGPSEGRFTVKTTAEYKAWFSAFARQANATEADLFRDAMREYATLKKFRKPPIR